MRGTLGFCGTLALGALALALLVPVRLQAEEKVFPVIDLHVDLPYRSLYKSQPFAWGSGQFVAEKLLPAGVSGVVLPLFVPEDAVPDGRSRAQLERSYAHVFSSILETPPYALPGCGVKSAGGKARSVGTWLAFEDADPVGADEREVQKWALRGVRSFGLVHSVPNRLASSSGRGGPRTSKDEGLTPEGRKFVEAVIQVGGLVDVSHASDRATDQAIEIAATKGAPIIATHSNARALAPHPRNLTDQQIRGVARSGGVVGVNFHQSFLAARPGAGAHLADVVAQIRYVARVGGVQSVALGSDFEGGISAVPELSDATRFQVLARALLQDGFTESEVRGIFADNARRVLCPPGAFEAQGNRP